MYNFKCKLRKEGNPSQTHSMEHYRRLKALEEENRQLKQLVADLSLDKQMLQDVLKKKL